MTKNKLIKLISIVLALTLLWQSVVWASDGFSVFRQKDTATCLRTLAFEERDTESAPGAGRVPNKRSVIFKTILLYGALAVVACVGVFVLMTAYSMGADIYSLLSAKEMWKLFASNTGMAFMALGLAGYSYAHILWVRLRDYLNQLSEFTKTPGEIPEHWPVDIYDPQPEKEATEAFWWREDRRYQRIRSDADLGMFKFPEGYDADKIRYYIRQEKKTHGRKVDFVMLYHFKENPGGNYLSKIADELVRVDRVRPLFRRSRQADIIRGIPINPALQDGKERLEYPVQKLASYHNRVKHIIVPRAHMTSKEEDREDKNATTDDELTVYRRNRNGNIHETILSTVPKDEIFGSLEADDSVDYILDLPGKKEGAKLWTRAMITSKTFFWLDFGNLIINYSGGFLMGYMLLSSQLLGQSLGIIPTFTVAWVVLSIFVGHFFAVAAKGLTGKIESDKRGMPEPEDAPAIQRAPSVVRRANGDGPLEFEDIREIQEQHEWMSEDQIRRLPKSQRGLTEEEIALLQRRMLLVTGVVVLSMIAFALMYAPIFNFLWPESATYSKLARASIWFFLAVIHSMTAVFQNSFKHQPADMNINLDIREGPTSRILGFFRRYFPLFAGGWRTNVWFNLAGISTAVVLQYICPPLAFIGLIVTFGTTFLGFLLYPAFADKKPHELWKIGWKNIGEIIAVKTFKALVIAAICGVGLVIAGGAIIGITVSLINAFWPTAFVAAAITLSIYGIRGFIKTKAREPLMDYLAKRWEEMPFKTKVISVTSLSVGLVIFIFFALTCINLNDITLVVSWVSAILNPKEAIAKGLVFDAVSKVYLVISGIIFTLFAGIFGPSFVRKWLWPELSPRPNNDGDLYVVAVHDSKKYAKDERPALLIHLSLGLIIGSASWLISAFGQSIGALAHTNFLMPIVAALGIILFTGRGFGKGSEASRLGEAEEARQARYGGAIDETAFRRRFMLKKIYVVVAVVTAIIGIILLTRHPVIMTFMTHPGMSHRLNFEKPWAGIATMVPMWMVIGFALLTFMQHFLSMHTSAYFGPAQRLWKEKEFHEDPRYALFKDKYYNISGYFRPRMFVYIQMAFMFLGFGLSRAHPTWEIFSIAIEPNFGLMLFTFACFVWLFARFSVPFEAQDFMVTSVVQKKDLTEERWVEPKGVVKGFISQEGGYMIVAGKDNLDYELIDISDDVAVIPSVMTHRVEIHLKELPQGVQQEDFDKYGFAYVTPPRTILGRWFGLRKFFVPHERSRFCRLKTASGAVIPFYAYGGTFDFEIAKSEGEFSYSVRIRNFRFPKSEKKTARFRHRCQRLGLWAKKWKIVRWFFKLGEYAPPEPTEINGKPVEPEQDFEERPTEAMEAVVPDPGPMPEERPERSSELEGRTEERFKEIEAMAGAI